MRFVKGHCAGNDFVLLADPDGNLDLDVDRVKAVCDRRRGLGGDGILRAVSVRAVPEMAHWVDAAEWFMDQRNADGSVAQMCGNGALLFARYLVDNGYANPSRFSIATRAGLREVRVLADGAVTVELGRFPVVRPEVPVGLGQRVLRAAPVLLDIPHAVCIPEDMTVEELWALDLSVPPDIPKEAFPTGTNLEILVHSEGTLTMRVYERGVGETSACGSCASAAAAAWVHRAGIELPAELTVWTRGGRSDIVFSDSNTLLRCWPVFVAEGVLSV